MAKKPNIRKLSVRAKEIFEQAYGVLEPSEVQLVRHKGPGQQDVVDMLYVTDLDKTGCAAYLTLNMHEASSGFEGDSVSTELIGVSSEDNEQFAQTIRQLALDCRWGIVEFLPGVTRGRVLDQDEGYVAELPHVLVVAPQLPWAARLTCVETSEGPVRYLQAVPISDDELQYSRLHGPDALLELFGERGTDLNDLARSSAVGRSDLFDGISNAFNVGLSERAKTVAIALAVAIGEPTAAIEPIPDKSGEPICTMLVAVSTDDGEAVSFATVDLADAKAASGRDRRTELVAVCRQHGEQFKTVVTDLAREYLTNDLELAPGVVHEGFLRDYPGLSTQLPHILLDYPRSYPELSQIDTSTGDIYGLQVIPISDSELEIVKEKGFLSLAMTFEGFETDLADLEREPIDARFLEGKPETKRLSSRSTEIKENVIALVGDQCAELETINNAGRSAQVQMVRAKDQPRPGLTTFATVNLNETKHVLDGEDFPVELLGIAYRSPDQSGMVATTAFNCMTAGMQAIPGVVHEGVLDLYHQHSATLRHVLITELWQWRAELGEVETTAGTVHRYQTLPISDAEYELYREHGYQELLRRLQDADIDYWDLDRPSVV